MRNKFYIHKAKIREIESDVLGEAVRLSAQVDIITLDGTKTKECYFDFTREYKEYLCTEKSDAFVMGLLTASMENDMDIEFEAPLSERLYYQMTTYYIPLVSKYNSKYPLHYIDLIGPRSLEIFESKNAVVTGCSGGVDSFYTMMKHSDCDKKHKITHIVFSSIATIDYLEERVKNTYRENLNLVKNIANDSNLKLIACYSNLHEFYKFPYKGFSTFFTTTYTSVGFALQKLISVYYASSGVSLDSFSMDVVKNKIDCATFDIFTVSCLNNENVAVYSTGSEANRNEKIEFVSDFDVVKKNLKVCAVDVLVGTLEGKTNCSKCKKCLRTMFSLYAINRLDEFSKVFDIEFFKANLARNIGKILSLDSLEFNKVSLKIAKKNNVKIPKTAFLWYVFIYEPKETLRKLLRDSLIARKIYYKFNLDIKMNGYRDATYENYKDKI